MEPLEHGGGISDVYPRWNNYDFLSVVLGIYQSGRTPKRKGCSIPHKHRVAKARRRKEIRKRVKLGK